jgi:flagellar basal-body rod protein FlgB
MSDQPVLMQMLNTQMHYTAQRQSVLATNIANVDMPGYKAQDLKKLDFADMAAAASNKLMMTTTSPKHLDGTLGGAGGAFGTEKQDKTFEITPTGNNVVLDEQMAKVSDNMTQSDIASTLLKKYTALYHDANGSH